MPGPYGCRWSTRGFSGRANDKILAPDAIATAPLGASSVVLAGRCADNPDQGQGDQPIGAPHTSSNMRRGKHCLIRWRW